MIIDHLIGLINRALALPVSCAYDLPSGNDVWQEVFDLSVQQRVLPLVVSLLETLPQDQIATGATAVKAYLVTEKTIDDQKRRYEAMARVAAFFSERNLDVMFLKGATLATRYPAPELRFFGDIDFYLFGEFKRGEEILTEHGGVSSGDRCFHHTQTILDGVLFENHLDFISSKRHSSNRVLDNALKAKASREKVPFVVPGGEPSAHTWRMSPTMEAVFLMRHMSKHFASSEMELRQFYDWVLLVREDGDLIDWREVSRLYEASGMMPFAQIVSWIVREKLCVDLTMPISPEGGPIAERVWSDVVNPRRRKIFRKNTFRYYLREAQVLLQNRWKYKLVSPEDSYMALVFKKLIMRLKLGW